MQMDWWAVAAAAGAGGLVIGLFARLHGLAARPAGAAAIIAALFVTASFLGHLIAHFDPTFGRTLMIAGGSAIAFMAPALALRELTGAAADRATARGWGALAAQLLVWTVALTAMGAVLALAG